MTSADAIRAWTLANQAARRTYHLDHPTDEERTERRRRANREAMRRHRASKKENTR